MSDVTTLLSGKESELIEAYAKEEGITPGEALRDLSIGNLKRRLQIEKKRGEVRTFRLPESD